MPRKPGKGPLEKEGFFFVLDMAKADNTVARLVERAASRWEQPAIRKFTRAIVILPELFTTFSHYSLLSGYLTSFGWEVCIVDLYGGLERRRCRFAELCDRAAETIAASGRKVIVLGHGFGGLVAFALDRRAAVAASVALAPALPGRRRVGGCSSLSPMLIAFSATR
jgi:dienelactone hydrolase